MMDQIGDNNDDRNWLDEIALKEAQSGLTTERRISQAAFFQRQNSGGSRTEIGISQAQVSRLEKALSVR